MLGLALFWILSYVVALAKLLFNFILEKRYVLIEMLLVLFKIAAQIHFRYHINKKYEIIPKSFFYNCHFYSREKLQNIAWACFRTKKNNNDLKLQSFSSSSSGHCGYQSQIYFSGRHILD